MKHIKSLKNNMGLNRMNEEKIFTTTSTTGDPLCDKCKYWTGYYCVLNKYQYKKVSCSNYVRFE